MKNKTDINQKFLDLTKELLTLKVYTVEWGYQDFKKINSWTTSYEKAKAVYEKLMIINLDEDKEDMDKFVSLSVRDLDDDLVVNFLTDKFKEIDNEENKNTTLKNFIKSVREDFENNLSNLYLSDIDDQTKTELEYRIIDDEEIFEIGFKKRDLDKLYFRLSNANIYTVDVSGEDYDTLAIRTIYYDEALEKFNSLVEEYNKKNDKKITEIEFREIESDKKIFDSFFNDVIDGRYFYDVEFHSFECFASRVEQEMDCNCKYFYDYESFDYPFTVLMKKEFSLTE